MKKSLLVMISVLLIVSMALAGCGKKEEAEPEPEKDEIGNPWYEVESAEEAAAGAKVESFYVEDIEISLGELGPVTWRYTTGIAEAQFPVAAVDMTVRKGDSSQTDFGDADCSGDYNTYKNQWTLDVDGIEVTCSGNRKGEATKTSWNGEKYSYAVLAYGAGGDDDFGLSEEDVISIVKTMK